MRVLLSLLVFFYVFSAMAEQLVYVSAKGDNTLDVYQFNSSNGKLALKEKVALKGAPGNSVISPDEKFLYVSVQSGSKKSTETGIETLAIQDNGSLKSVGYGKTPQFCGFLAMDSKGQYLFSSHFAKEKFHPTKSRTVSLKDDFLMI